MFDPYGIAALVLSPPEIFVLVGVGLVFLIFLPPLLGQFRQPTTRGFSTQNLPRMFLVLGGMLGVIALLSPLSRQFFMAGEGDLTSFAGTLLQAPTRDANGLLRISLQTSDGERDLLVEDLSHLQEIMNLQPGDSITARAQSLLGENHIWELEHNGVVIESYEEMREFSDQKLQQGKAPALWVGFVASIFLVLAIVLRLVFGVWSQPVEQSVLGRPVMPPDDRA